MLLVFTPEHFKNAEESAVNVQEGGLATIAPKQPSSTPDNNAKEDATQMVVIQSSSVTSSKAFQPSKPKCILQHERTTSVFTFSSSSSENYMSREGWDIARILMHASGVLQLA